MSNTDQSPLRIVTFNNLPVGFNTVRRWAEQAGHTLALLVTTPGPTTRRTESYKGILAELPPELDVLVTTRLRKVALPLIRELSPDLIVSATFPYRLPPEIRGLARLGAINLHPTVLPAYRGPNPLRAVFDGAPTIGATLHWMDDDFDTGRVLSQHSAPLPADLTVERFIGTWAPLLGAALAEGAARAIAGERGYEQDEAGASYGAAFTPEEQWLSWDEPGYRLQQKCVALTLMSRARAMIGGAEHRIMRVDPLPGSRGAHMPGSIIAQDEGGLTIACGDGAARVVAKPATGA